MKPTIIVCGHGPGISDAVARRFGKEGFAVALVARNTERLTAASSALTGAGITAKGFPCNLGNPEAARYSSRVVASPITTRRST
jgi:short-subunit dehydrogenase